MNEYKVTLRPSLACAVRVKVVAESADIAAWKGYIQGSKLYNLDLRKGLAVESVEMVHA